MTNFEQLFLEVKKIHAKHEQIARETGANFNIFKILGVQSSEVQLHSAFIAELLNPKGSHGQGTLFLEFFMEQVGIDFAFDCSNAKVVTEEYIGSVTDTTGGQIDILISDRNSCIVIENKIYADDKENQLIRYDNYCRQQYESHQLLYLTLDGKNASEESIRELKEAKEEKVAKSTYKSISYQEHISNWLEKCLEKSENLPTIKATIQQYMTIIKNLTNQSTNNTMDNEIINLITKTPENMEVTHKIVECFDGAKQIILHNFWSMLCFALEDSLKEKGLSVKQKNVDFIKKYYNKRGKKERKKIISLWVVISEIKEKDNQYLCWGAEIYNNFYTGFRICDNNGEKIPINDDDEFNKKYRNILRKRNYMINKSFLGWKYSRPKLNFKDFNSQDIFSLAIPNVLKDIVGKIVMEALNEIEDFKQEIS